MQNIHILYADPGLNHDILIQCLADIRNLEPVRIWDLYRHELMENGKLKQEINSYLTKGELVPAAVTEKLILNNIQANKNSLMVGYPLTADQLRSFKSFCAKEKFVLSHCWYFKIEGDFNMFMKNKFDEGGSKKWHDKFGEEMEQSLMEKYRQFRSRIEDLVTAGVNPWTTIGLNYDEYRDREIVSRKISASTQAT